MDTTEEITTLINLSWDDSIDDDTRDSMLSHFEFMDSGLWDKIKQDIACSPSVQRVIDTIDTLREMG